MIRRAAEVCHYQSGASHVCEFPDRASERGHRVRIKGKWVGPDDRPAASTGNRSKVNVQTSKMASKRGYPLALVRSWFSKPIFKPRRQAHDLSYVQSNRSTKVILHLSLASQHCTKKEDTHTPQLSTKPSFRAATAVLTPHL